MNSEKFVMQLCQTEVQTGKDVLRLNLLKRQYKESKRFKSAVFDLTSVCPLLHFSLPKKVTAHLLSH